MQLRKLFEHICNLAVTPAQIAELRALLDRCHQRMLVSAVEREDNTGDTGRDVRTDNDIEDTKNDNGSIWNTMDDIEEECTRTRKTTLQGLQSYSAICTLRRRKRLRPVSSPLKR